MSILHEVEAIFGLVMQVELVAPLIATRPVVPLRRKRLALLALGREAAEKVRGLADWVETRLPQIVQGWEARGDH
ncbi:hypothetical protein [uncultured Jannaschia sp.]|uniref:hypothetical protein n=1 Tax=uncultured Jannaschia sp. TaxID=293347 RepID=UPI0026106CDB|nr:hypothetical protein [uncultured Jannaschia sp.]